MSIHASELDVVNLNKINNGSLPPHELMLRVGIPVMLLRNISIEQGLCNGTILEVEQLGATIIRLKQLNGPFAGQSVVLPRFIFDHDEVARGGVAFKRVQFPIRPCFAMTITKSQGGTYDRVGIHLRNHEVFAHGMLYVGLSRVTTRDGIVVFCRKPPANQDATVDNVVYQGWNLGQHMPIEAPWDSPPPPEVIAAEEMMPTDEQWTGEDDPDAAPTAHATEEAMDVDEDAPNDPEDAEVEAIPSADTATNPHGCASEEEGMPCARRKKLRPLPLFLKSPQLLRNPRWKELSPGTRPPPLKKVRLKRKRWTPPEGGKNSQLTL